MNRNVRSEFLERIILSENDRNSFLFPCARMHKCIVFFPLLTFKQHKRKRTIKHSTNHPVQVVRAGRLCHRMPQTLASVHGIQHLCGNRRVGQRLPQMNAVFPWEKRSDITFLHPSKAVEKLKAVTLFKSPDVLQCFQLPDPAIERKVGPMDAPDPWVFFEIRIPFWRTSRPDVLVQDVRDVSSRRVADLDATDLVSVFDLGVCQRVSPVEHDLANGLVLGEDVQGLEDVLFVLNEEEIILEEHEVVIMISDLFQDALKRRDVPCGLILRSEFPQPHDVGRNGLHRLELLAGAVVVHGKPLRDHRVAVEAAQTEAEECSAEELGALARRQCGSYFGAVVVQFL